MLTLTAPIKPPYDDGCLTRWFIAPGGAVAAGDTLATLQTAELVLSIQAPAAGTLHSVLVPVGQVILPGEPLALLAEPTDAAVTPALPAKEIAPMAESARPVVPILMPQAGQSMEEGTIVAWNVAHGDTIAVGQIIMEIETDKATMEVEATDAGRLARILAPVGAVVPVKEPVALLADADADAEAWLAAQGQAPAASAASAPAPEPTPVATPAAPAGASDGGRVKASPAARKLAAGRGIDLHALGAGSGPGGRILSTDIPAAPAAAVSAGPQPLSRMRRAIARNLQQSKQTIPHFYLDATIDAGPLWTLWRATRERFACSLNDFIVAASARALREFPGLRSRWQEDSIVEQPGVHIGIAVGTDDGLTVPVLLDADRLDLKSLAARGREIIESARAGRLTGAGQGVFTITNLGMFGVDSFQAIINPPEAAILAVGAVREAVIVENGAMRPGRLLTLSISADHRIVDGLLAARFMQRLRALLESPDPLLELPKA